MGDQFKVLLVDDDPSTLRVLRMEFTIRGFSTVLASSPEEALEHTSNRQWPDIAVIDLMLPSMSGIRLMNKLRERKPLPAIILTARTSEADLIRGLENGADDYVTKPFSLDELTARVRAVLRRSAAAPHRVFRQGDVEVNMERRLVIKRGEIIRLSRTEWAVLEHLASHPGTVVSYEALHQKLWRWGASEDTQNARVWISRLRRKIEDDPSHPKLIRTIHQQRGYAFALCDEADGVDDFGAALQAQDVPLNRAVAQTTKRAV